MSILSDAKALTTDRDRYYGLIDESGPVIPNNILLFTRTRLRPQDFAGAVHHRYVMILFLKTHGTVFIQRHRVVAREHQAVLIRPYEPHYYALPSDPIIWLFITFELPPDSGYHFDRPVQPLDEDAIKTVKKLIHAYQGEDIQQSRLLLALLLAEINPGNIEWAAPADPEEDVAGKVNRYIHRHLEHPFSIADLARHCGLSASHLRQRFRAAVGVSLGQYIRRNRMDRAAHLLLTTRRTVSEIAYGCGFTAPAIFCRAFRNQNGCSPGVFRTQRTRTSAPSTSTVSIEK